VGVQTGQSYLSRREEGFDKYTQMAQYWPALLQIGGPSILRMSDIPGASALADLLEKGLPPEFQSQPDGGQQIPPAVMAKLKQADDFIQLQHNRISALEQEVLSKEQDRASKEFITMMQEETKRLIAAANVNHESGTALLMAELQGIKRWQDQMESERQRQHETIQAALDRTADALNTAMQQQGNQPGGQGAPGGATPPGGPAMPPPPSGAQPGAQPAAT
jgi:hypothetical protein